MSRRNEGHLLIIPSRHVAGYFSVTTDEKTADTITNTDLPKTRGIPLIHLGACAA